jgi:hypothetical protein
MAEDSKLRGLNVNEMVHGSSCSLVGESSNTILDKTVDWNGPDDPERPVNWPRSKKIQILGAVCLMRFTT